MTEEYYFKYSRYEALAEALLFAAGDVVLIDDASVILKLSRDDTISLFDRLDEKYNKLNGGIMLRKIKDGFQLSTRPDLHDDLRDYFERPSKLGLSRAAMETLSVVAYNQPITRAGIELVRGVNSDGVLAKLIEKGFVAESGRSENPGRPILYSTTVHFLRSLGISDLTELPPLELSSDDAVTNILEEEQGEKIVKSDYESLEIPE